jgi:hypothetical protein
MLANPLKEALCLRCRNKNKDHSFNEVLRCKYLLEYAHANLMQEYVKLTSKNSSETEQHELEDK